MKPLKRNQHYVYQHYLRAWSVNNKIICNRMGKLFSVNVSNVAVERDFYKLAELKEEHIKFIEWTILQSDSSELKELNKQWVSVFSQYSILKKSLDEEGINSENITLELRKMEIEFEEDYHFDIESRAIPIIEYIRMSIDLKPLKDRETKNDFFYYLSVQFFRTKKIKDNFEASFRASLPEPVGCALNMLRAIYATNVTRSILHYKTILLINNTDEQLITSDQPIINIAGIGKKVLKDEDMEYYYPVAPHVAILVSNSEKYYDFQKLCINESDVDHYNKSMEEVSHNMIFSHPSFKSHLKFY